jgi:alcohol dehydrogenase class IV
METILTGSWNYPTPIRFGAGRIRELPDACRELGISRPLLVADKGLAELDITRDAVAMTTAAGLPTTLFSQVDGNPTGENVEAGLAVFRDAGCDGVIAFGGGSALDVAKAVALMVGQTRPLWDFEDVGDWWTRVDPDGMVPVVAVPTTAGTGSEVGRASVITDTSTHTKKIIFHPGMLPGRVIADPQLTVGLPAGLTAATGMDALSHLLEAYCAPGFHPMADGIAIEGMRLVQQALPRAVADGTDIEARAMMLAAASMGATAFQKGLGGMHALAHPLGAVHNTHHGMTNAVLMPYVLDHNLSAIEERLAWLARALGLASPTGAGFIAWVVALRDQLGLPTALGGLRGIDPDTLDVGSIATMAAADPSAGGNPRPFDATAAAQVLEQALAGTLRAL